MASGGGGGGSRRKSLFERLTKEDDPKLQQDIALGRRIGLYRIKTQLGAGTFAKVKLGIHLLTNGNPFRGYQLQNIIHECVIN